MKWILIVPALMIGVVGAVICVGLLLPKAHLASRKASYRSPPEKLYALLSNFADAPQWRTHLAQVQLLAPRDGKLVFRETGSQGILVFQVEELVPNQTIVTRIVDNSQFGGSWTYQLTPTPTGSQLTITERGEVYNPIFRFLSHFFFSQTATIESFLVDLAKAVGETTKPEPV